MAKRFLTHSFPILWVSGAIIFSPLTANSQDWAYFHAEAVRSITCKVATTTLTENGGLGWDVYSATASAKREGMENWQFTLGYFPATERGADQAIDACKKWRREASKRIKQAHDH